MRPATVRSVATSSSLHLQADDRTGGGDDAPPAEGPQTLVQLAVNQYDLMLHRIQLTTHRRLSKPSST
jgi:hypothetical protein